MVDSTEEKQCQEEEELPGD